MRRLFEGVPNSNNCYDFSWFALNHLIVHGKKTQAIILGDCPLKDVFFTLVTLLYFKNNLYFEFHMIPDAILHKSQTLKNKIK